MSNIKIYENIEFGKINVLEENNTIYFKAQDVCKALDIKNTTQAIQRLDSDEVTMLNIGGLSGETNFINEYGLYSLVLASRKPEAKEFKRWITHEVIPSIRKNGGYIANQNQLDEKELLAKAVIVSDNIIKNKNKQLEEKNRLLEEQKPKVLFAENVSKYDKGILVREMAKYLKQSGYDTGEERLFEQLRQRGFLISKKGEDYNTPTQKSVDMGVIRLDKREITKPNGAIFISKTPRITGEGQVYFFNLFMKEVKSKNAR